MNRKKILLLENVAAQAAGLREQLSQAGFQVAVSRYEADGLKRLAEWGPDLVLVSTAHTAGDFVEYCRRVRKLTPEGRIIVASSLNSGRLFREHAGLQTLVDGVVLRPVNHEEITAMFAPAPVAPRAPAADQAVDSVTAELRAEFQRQLDARFLEVEELKRRLAAATRGTAAVPDLERLQSENAHLRQGAEEARKKVALTLATEQLKRSEIEVKLDNLLRMKEDFEFRAQNEIEDRTREIGRVRGQLQELRERSDKATEEHAALRVELERAASAERGNEQLHAACAALEERLAASEAARISVTAEAEAAVEQIGARATSLAAELAQAARGHEEELAGSAERLEKAVRELDESERRVAALRGELAAAEQAHDQENRLLTERVAAESAAAREAVGRVEIADAALVAAREDFAARLREARLQLEGQQASFRELEEKLAARAVSEAGASQVQAELHRIQELLEQVISRARTEAVDYARRDAELSVRLQAALDERRLLQERFDRANTEATERERRSSSLLQSAIDHGPARRAERDNLPAVVPLDPISGTPRRRPVMVGLAVVALAALLAVFGLRSTTPPAVRERQVVVPRPQSGASPGAAVTPPGVWDRWTRSDTSGGVLVQATLRGKQELRAEIEAGSARGMSDEDALAELARRLSAFRFDTTYYVAIYLKNLAPGYPAFLDDLPGHFRLRDSSGSEVPAFLPPGHEKDRRIFSFGAGDPGGLIYEASVSLGFDRAGLSPSADYLQLVVSDVGAVSRRVLTWELE